MASSQGKEEHMETTEEKRERFRKELKEAIEFYNDPSKTKVYRRVAKRRWPFYKMKIGDVVTIKNGEYGATSPQIYAHKYGRDNGKKFRTKEIAQDTYSIVRIA